MIKSSSANVQFTPEQALQLVEWQKRLAVLQDEIKNKEVTLAGLKDAIVVAEKHNAYLETHTRDLESQVEAHVGNKERIVSESDLQMKAMAKHASEANRREAEVSQKEETLLQRENELSANEQKMEAQRKALSENEKALSHEKALVEKAKEAFLQALLSVVWK